MNIDELRKLGKEATEGRWETRRADGADPWVVVTEWSQGRVAVIGWRVRDEGEPDARFIATARNAWDAMCDNAEMLERVIDEVAHANDCASRGQFIACDCYVAEARQALTRLQEVGG